MWKEANLLQVLGVDEAGIQWSILNTQRGGNQKEKQEWFLLHSFSLQEYYSDRTWNIFIYLRTTSYHIYDQS